MRILQITNRVPWPLNDGGNLATYNVTRLLKAQGHEVVLASLNTRKHHVNPADFPETVPLHTHDIDTTVTKSGLIRGLLASFPYNVSRFIDDEFESMLSSLVSENDFDIIQFEGSYLAYYIPALRKISRAKFVLRSHNVEHQIWDRLAKSEPNPLKRAYLKNLTPKIRKYEKETLSLYDGIIAITEKDEDWYRREGFSGELITVNAGVDLETYRPSGRQPVLDSLCFIGSLEWMPNVNGLRWFIRQVWEPLSREFPEKRFHVAGKNPPQELRDMRVPGMVFHGMVPDAVEFMDSFGVLITPLLSGGGMRLKVVEAMAMGKCVISTSIGAEGIRYTAGKDIFIADDPQSFIRIIKQLWKEPRIIQKTGENAKLTATEHYNWEKLILRFENFYQRLN